MVQINRIEKEGAPPNKTGDKIMLYDGIDKLLDLAEFLFYDLDNSTQDNEYLKIILPRLKASVSKGKHEKKEVECLAQIRSELSEEEWENLEEVVAKRIQHKRETLKKRTQSSKKSKYLNDFKLLLKKYKFREANDKFYEYATDLEFHIENSELDIFEVQYNELKKDYESQFFNGYKEKFKTELIKNKNSEKLSLIILELEERSKASEYDRNFLKKNEAEFHHMTVQKDFLVNLIAHKFCEADKLVQDNPNFFEPLEDYEILKNTYIQESINTKLSSYEFLEADTMMAKYPDAFTTIEEYEKTKANEVGNYLGWNIDEDQALSIAKVSQNLLVKARAGSGKTRTILYKTKLLLEKYNIKPSEILILAFNPDAANEIQERLQKLEIFFKNAMSFHAFAKRLSKPEEDILSEKNKKRDEFLKDILNQKVWNERFQENLYRYFRKELVEVERYGIHLTENEELQYRRNLQHVTLKGEDVDLSPVWGTI